MPDVWVLMLNDMRSSHYEYVLPVARADTKEALLAFVEGERVPLRAPTKVVASGARASARMVQPAFIRSFGSTARTDDAGHRDAARLLGDDADRRLENSLFAQMRSTCAVV